MSGGVDSCVSAAMLKEQGYNIVGITMRVWEDPNALESRHGACCTLDDATDARMVAERLGIPHYTLNVKARFKEKVVDYFVSEYLDGKTPNPCVVCNQAIKFDYLFEQGKKFGASRIATGHYARLDTFKGHTVIRKGVDAGKDQSYFLFSINPQALDKIMFPLGELTKTETRAMAEKLGLNVAKKKESQEICFVPGNDYREFISQTPAGANITNGPMVNSQGRSVGRHKGYPFYTIGQRRGLGVSAPAPMYVTRIDPAANRVYVGSKNDLYGRRLKAVNMNWYLPPATACGLNLTARVRHQGKDAPATVTPSAERSATVAGAGQDNVPVR